MKLAQLIPIDNINAIVNKNIIANAVAISSNAYMKYLFVLWYNYIETNGEGDLECAYCLQNVLHNFKLLQEDIIEIYKENLLLESL